MTDTQNQDPTPGPWALRVAPDGRVAQLVHLGHGNGHTNRDDWLCMTWPDGLLTANLLTSEDVADWRPINLEES